MPGRYCAFCSSVPCTISVGGEQREPVRADLRRTGRGPLLREDELLHRGHARAAVLLREVRGEPAVREERVGPRVGRALAVRVAGAAVLAPVGVEPACGALAVVRGDAISERRAHLGAECRLLRSV